MWEYNGTFNANRVQDNTCIEHEGIKGMRWGVITWKKRRQEKNRTPSSSNSSKNKSSEQHKVDSKPDIKKMSDAELNAIVNRIRLEQAYNQLTYTPKQKSAIKRIASEVAEKTVKDVSTKLLTTVLNNAIEKRLKVPMKGAAKK